MFFHSPISASVGLGVSEHVCLTNSKDARLSLDQDLQRPIDGLNSVVLKQVDGDGRNMKL